MSRLSKRKSRNLESSAALTANKPGGTGGEVPMSKKTDEMNYRLCLALAASLKKKGVLSTADYEEIRRILLSQYMPYISRLSA